MLIVSAKLDSAVGTPSPARIRDKNPNPWTGHAVRGEGAAPTRSTRHGSYSEPRRPVRTGMIKATEENQAQTGK